MMDPLDALTTNSQLYWARLEDSKRCFEFDISLTAPVHIVDVPAAAKPQLSSPLPLKKQECPDLKILEDYLGDPMKADYSFRLM